MQQGPGAPNAQRIDESMELRGLDSQERLIDPNYMPPRSISPYSHESKASMSSMDISRGAVGNVYLSNTPYEQQQYPPSQPGSRPSSRQNNYSSGSIPTTRQQTQQFSQSNQYPNPQAYPPSQVSTNRSPPTYYSQVHGRTGSQASVVSMGQPPSFNNMNQWGQPWSQQQSQSQQTAQQQRGMGHQQMSSMGSQDYSQGFGRPTPQHRGTGHQQMGSNSSQDYIQGFNRR
jgi:hypothetical protein